MLVLYSSNKTFNYGYSTSHLEPSQVGHPP